MQLCDTHCHLDNVKYNEDFEAMLKRSYEVGVRHFIIPAAHPDDLKKAQSLSHTYEGVYFAVGIHPSYAHLYNKDFLQSFVNDEKCVAIGECGLDYYRVEESLQEMGLESFEALRDLQKQVFIEQIQMAIEVRKPLIVHIREASLDSLEILLNYAQALNGGVLHCFNADSELLDLAKYGFYYGIGGVLTFKNAKKLVEVLPKIPLHSLLLETDSPYLAPHPHRGERNEPSYIPLVLEKMSEILAIPKETLAEQINHNTQNLFGKYFRII